MGKQENQIENKSGFWSFMEGSGGKALFWCSALCAVACLAFSGFKSYGIVKEESTKSAISLDENSSYNAKDDVAAYIHKYGHLPDNYMTKIEAQMAGWTGGSVYDVVPGASIGGDRFYDAFGDGNRLEVAEGRYYTECDVNTDGAEIRGAERLIYSNDGLIYYTNDHYESFYLLYGQEVLDEFY